MVDLTHNFSSGTGILLRGLKYFAGNLAIHTDHEIHHRRTNITEHKNKVFIIEISVPGDSNVESNEKGREKGKIPRSCRRNK